MLKRLNQKQKRNNEMAVKWLQEAASQGSDSAMADLGTMYEAMERSKIMTKPSSGTAGSIVGHFLAIQWLGEMYEQGLGTGSVAEAKYEDTKAQRRKPHVRLRREVWGVIPTSTRQ